MLHVNLQISKIFQSYVVTTDLLKKYAYHRHITYPHILPFVPIFLQIYVFLFFQAQELTTILFRSIEIPLTTFSSNVDNILFQLTRICFLYSMTF